MSSEDVLDPSGGHGARLGDVTLAALHSRAKSMLQRGGSKCWATLRCGWGCGYPDAAGCGSSDRAEGADTRGTVGEMGNRWVAAMYEGLFFCPHAPLRGFEARARAEAPGCGPGLDAAIPLWYDFSSASRFARQAADKRLSSFFA